VIIRDPYEEFGRSGRQCHALYSYASCFGVGAKKLAVAIGTLGKLPMENNEARAVYPWVGNYERTVLDLSRSCIARTAAERK